MTGADCLTIGIGGNDKSPLDAGFLKDSLAGSWGIVVGGQGLLGFLARDYHLIFRLTLNVCMCLAL
jgi:hypothetical protein